MGPQGSARALNARRKARCGSSLCHPVALLCLAWLLSSALGETIRYHTYEEDPPGTVIGTLADDLPLRGPGGGGGGGEERRFRLVKASGNSSLVRVRERDGQLSLGAERLDREALCGQAEEPCVLAFDVVNLSGPRGGGGGGGSSPSPYRLVHVELEVRDINDHAPRFPQPLIALEVSESAAPGTRLPLDLAHDLDVGSNAIQSFAVSPNSHFGLEAQSRADGLKCAELVLLTELDREAQASYRLELVAKDGGSPARSGTATVSVRVLDANDNAPTFPHGALLTVELPEDALPGALLLDLDASDPDEGANGQLLYAWGSQVPTEARDLFALDPLSGRLSLRAAVDYELQRAYELDVQASDRGASPLAASCKVVVRLLDVNDNAPAVAISVLSPSGGGEGAESEPGALVEGASPEGASAAWTVAYVNEATPTESLVALVSTSDSDAGANGQVHCALLAAPHEPFALQRAYDASYVVLTTGALDRERVPEYNLTVVAEDMGSPPAKTVHRLTVRLTDENDNAPRFAKARYEVAVRENNPPGAYLATISAADPDQGTNGKVTYHLTESQILGASISTYVSVDPATGAIYALRTFNYEILKKLELTVQAMDSGSPQLSTAALVKVQVIDQNDNAPVITHPALTNGSLEIRVPRTAAHNSVVAHIQARDADEGVNAELSFSFQEDPQQQQSPALDLFAINKKTGEVVLSRSFSEEHLGQVHQLLLIVADAGRPPLSTTVPISFQVTAALLPSSSQDSKVRPNAGEGKALQWDIPLIVIIVLAGSCTLLLVAIITIATRCNRCKKEKKEVLEEPLGSSHLEKKGQQEGKGGGDLISCTSPGTQGNGLEGHSFPSKSSFASPEPPPASADTLALANIRETDSLHGSRSRLRGTNAESYASTPSYSKEPVLPVAMWKGHSFNTISGREAEKFSGKDSGKGDSDFNDSDSDVSGDALKKDLIMHMQNGLWACTAECKILGHSDRCWSPSCGQANLHSSPHPKTQLSTFCKSTSLPRDSLSQDNCYQPQLPKTVGLQSVCEKVLHRDYAKTITLLSPPHQGRLPDLQEISVPLYQAPANRYLGPKAETCQKI